MKKFHPTLIPTLCTIPALIVLLALGSWQVHRLLWKETLITDIEKKSHIAALAYPAVTDALPTFKYTKVWVEGTFLNDKEIHLYVGPREFGGRPGYEIITPLKRADTGTVILIERGWVPTEKKLSSTRPETLLIGKQHIEGLVLEGEQKKWFTPQNDPIHNIWLWIDMKAIASFIGVKPEPFLIMEVGKKEVHTLPIPSDGTIQVRNDHLQYAITWYSLALILLVVYIIYHRKK